MRYDLDAASVRAAAAPVLASSRDRGGRFLCVIVRPDEPLADVAGTVERQVFQESFGNDSSVMTAEYGPYEDHSLHFLVLDRRTGMPAGAGRVIHGAPGQIKTIADAPAYIGRDADAIVAAHGMDDGGMVWEFATAAVLPAYRGGSSALAVSSLIYRSFLLTGYAAGARHVVVMLDKRAYRNMRLLGVHLTALAGSGPFEYLGSAENHALYVEFEALRPAIAEQAVRLRRPGRGGTGEIRARGLRGLLTRRVAAGVSHRVSTGKGLDRHILLPG